MLSSLALIATIAIVGILGMDGPRVAQAATDVQLVYSSGTPSSVGVSSGPANGVQGATRIDNLNHGVVETVSSLRIGVAYQNLSSTVSVFCNNSIDVSTDVYSTWTAVGFEVKPGDVFYDGLMGAVSPANNQRIYCKAGDGIGQDKVRMTVKQLLKQ